MLQTSSVNSGHDFSAAAWKSVKAYAAPLITKSKWLKPYEPLHQHNRIAAFAAFRPSIAVKVQRRFALEVVSFEINFDIRGQSSKVPSNFEDQKSEQPAPLE